MKENDMAMQISRAREVTYLGRRATVQTYGPPKGKHATVITHIDDADPRNGGHPAGTRTFTVTSGDARKGTLVHHVPTTVLDPADDAEQMARAALRADA